MSSFLRATSRHCARAQPRSAAIPSGTQATRSMSGWRVAREALTREFVEIVLPDARVIAAEFVKIIPAVDAGGVQVVEHETHRIVADRMDFQDRHVALAGHRLSLVRGMALHLGARADHAQ